VYLCVHVCFIIQGIYTKHLQYYLDNASSRVSKYSSALDTQYSAVFHYATGADYATGSVWYGPDEGGSQFTPEAANSGLAAIVAAAKVRWLLSLF
jgi:hypothetical protein